MTRFTTYMKPGHSQHNHSEASSSEDQVIYLKRLLVTLKQRYEKNIEDLSHQLQVENTQKQTLQKECDRFRLHLQETRQNHEEDQVSLKQQQTTLKELLKKAQEELKRIESAPPCISQKREEEKLETERLRQELKLANEQVKELELRLAQEQSNRQSDKSVHESTEGVLKINYFDQADILQELEQIKEALRLGTEETKRLKECYSEAMHEKTEKEHHIKRLESMLEAQSSKNLQENDRNRLEEIVQEKENLQEKYEQLREELAQLSERLEETLDVRLKANDELSRLQSLNEDQDKRLALQAARFQAIADSNEQLQKNVEELTILLTDSEARLKVAQQHLAKKVKEATLLNEKVESQQNSFQDNQKTLEQAKSQISHLQASLDLYQKQEAKLQEQLHDTLRSTESQVVRWEEKYFAMCDKWQASEERVRELKKFEEKHVQMQSLLTNLGHFMGSSSLISTHPLANSQDISYFQAELLTNSISENPLPSSALEEKMDLFGMRQPQEKSKSTS